MFHEKLSQVVSTQYNIIYVKIYVKLEKYKNISK